VSFLTLRSSATAPGVDEWEEQSTAPGVFYRNNFTYRDTAESLLITSDAQLRASGAQTGGTASLIVYDTVNKLTGGGSLRFNMPAASPGDYSGWNIDFGGIAVSSKLVVKHQFYLRFALYADSVYRGFHYGASGVWGGKICIISAPNVSDNNGEVVFRRWEPPGGFVKGYRKNSGNYDEFGLLMDSGNDLVYNNFIDRGSPTVTNENTRQQRYGPNYLGRTSTTGDDADYQHAPKLKSNGWTIIEALVDQDNDIIKWWMADEGDPPELIMGAMSARLPAAGTLDGAGQNEQQLYTGVQFTNYPNTATNWPGTDTFICYADIIASDDPIPFPGGHALPYPGTDVPPGYPPAGSTEQ
jgi:hypothetical protein